jgi:TRAP-type C4-dicarboxylate transport system substrate-binding protein
MPNGQQKTLVLILAICSAAGTTAAADKPIVVKLATVLPKGTSYYQVLQAMGEEWRKASGGGVSLTIFTDSTMGDEPDIVRRMRVGQLQAAMLSGIGLSDIERSVNGLQYMPMMFRSLAEVDFIREKLQPRLDELLLRKGFVALFWGDAGWIRFFSKEPALFPADFKKFKMFVWSGDNYQVDLMKAMGYQPVPLVTGDILPGLQTGMISAIALAPFYALASQVYGSASHMLELNWAPLIGAAVISKKVWDAIPVTTRAAMEKSARAAGEQMKMRGRAEADQSVEAMKKRGLKVQGVSVEAEAAWRKVAEGIYPKIRGVMVPEDVFDDVQRLLGEYRSSNGTLAK